MAKIEYNIPVNRKGDLWTVEKASGRKIWCDLCGQRTAIIIQDPDDTIVHYATGKTFQSVTLSQVKDLYKRDSGGSVLKSANAYVDWFLKHLEAKLGRDVLLKAINKEKVLNHD